MARKRAKRFTRYWWNKKYNEYQKEFNTLVEHGYTEKEGFERLESVREFKEAYLSTTEEIRLKGRKRPSSVSKKLAEDSFFDFNRAEAKAIRNYFREKELEAREEDISLDTDITKATLRDIMAGRFDRESIEFYDFIRSERKRLFSEGNSKSEVAMKISHLYFGSPV